MSLFFYLFTFAIDLWHRNFVTAVFVNNWHGIQQQGQDFDKNTHSEYSYMRKRFTIGVLKMTSGKYRVKPRTSCMCMWDAGTCCSSCNFILILDRETEHRRRFWFYWLTGRLYCTSPQWVCHRRSCGVSRSSHIFTKNNKFCLLYTSPSPRD